MRVACIGTGWFPETPGGLERYLYGLVRSLAVYGDIVDFYTLGHATTLGGASNPHSIGDVQDSLLRRVLSAGACYARELPRTCDVVNVHFALTALPALPFIPRNVPVVYHFHGPWWEESRREGAGTINVLLKKQIERIVFKRCAHFITQSSAFKAKLCSSFAIPEHCVSVLALGLDTDAFAPTRARRAAREKLRWPLDRFIAFTARRLVHRVGLPALLVAVADVVPRHPDLWLAIAGKGPLADSLRHDIAEMRLTDHVRLLGCISDDDLVAAYQAADITVVPSQDLEGFGSIVAESLACGTPVIATPVGGMPEWLAPLEPSLLMEGCESASIARALDAVLTGSMPLPDSQRCRAYALQTFSWPVVAAGVREVLHTYASRSA
jgi:glycosyltransferase involved in cell wall biosynthesis